MQPIPLDSSGRPLFPIVLGGLTVYSLGEVSVWLQFTHSFYGVRGQNATTSGVFVCALHIFFFFQIITDRMSFHEESAIYPVGFCSTRVFASMKNLEQQCLYTCQIKDGGTGPQVGLFFFVFFFLPNSGVDCNFQFEIVPEDDPQNAVVASSARTCYANLLKVTASSRYHTKQVLHFSNVFGKIMKLYVHNLAPSPQHPSYHQERTSLAFHTQPSRTSSRVVLEHANAASKYAR